MIGSAVSKTLVTTVVGCLASGLLSWLAASFTLVGRVQAIESTLSRIELRLDNLTPKGKP